MAFTRPLVVVAENSPDVRSVAVTLPPETVIPSFPEIFSTSAEASLTCRSSGCPSPVVLTGPAVLVTSTAAPFGTDTV